ncbi:hypothetical protein BST97_11150 [Nonlabens spongiae]|uniref:Uncharacterized protein n=1 Tax=Nonlabens spongiae TaxID=331648 RepID=A0A1W6MLZ6_9FLAO|nr:hypothetical protein [Nonlabens spongiae]ARN78499.1 hypothetical protein BST97_11150 [Nonlabens spongiae]
MSRKVFLILLMVVGLAGCSLDDDNRPNVVYGYVGVDAVDVPDSFELGETYEIEVDLTLSNPCLDFAGFDMIRAEENTRIVRTVVAQYEGTDCDQEEARQITEIFEFQVIFTEDYTFKFLNGVDENGEETFLEFVVPVNS